MFFEKMSNMPATLTKMPLSCGDHVSTPVAAQAKITVEFDLNVCFALNFSTNK